MDLAQAAKAKAQDAVDIGVGYLAFPITNRITMLLSTIWQSLFVVSTPTSLLFVVRNIC